MAILLDGKPIGDETARLRSPSSSFYEKSYLEGLSTARVLVKLELDSNVAGLKSSDKPDIIVSLRDGSMVDDNAPIEHALQDANIAPFDRVLVELLDSMTPIVRDAE